MVVRKGEALMRGLWMRAGRALPLVALLLVALVTLRAPAPARAALMVLYDGSAAGETPLEQGYFDYATWPSPPAAAEAGPVSGGTRLSTTGALTDYAGFFTPAGRMPAMDREEGYTLRFVAQVLAESHHSDDRAGLSVIALGEDSRGVELGLWSDRVWAQNDGADLFTQGEGAELDLATRPVDFALDVRGDGYSLTADGAVVLSGSLRLYRPVLSPEAPFAASYYLPNFIFLGDNTSRAGAEVRLLAVSLETAAPSGPPETPVPTGPPATAVPTEPPAPPPSPTRPPQLEQPDELVVWLYLPVVWRR